MIAIGIDIGLTGAVSAVGPSGCSVHDMPTVPDGKKGRRIDGRALILLLRTLVPVGQTAMLVFEDVRARPMGNGGRQGNTMHSQGSLMRSRGAVETAADITRFEVRVVQPQAWKRACGLLKTDKKASLEVARRLFPSAAAELARVKDHNRGDALLIAHYALGRFA